MNWGDITFMGKRFTAWCAMIAVMVGVPACAGAGGGGVAGGGAGARPARAQSDAEIAEIMRGLKPSERFVPAADARLLWQATSGYMERAFPLDELPASASEGPGRQLRTKLVQWTGDGLPHRTRVFVENRPDPANPANMRLRVVALLIEAQPDLAAATDGQPIDYAWRLHGSNARIEEAVIEQIMNRYAALREGRPIPVDEELVVPIQRPASG